MNWKLSMVIILLTVLIIFTAQNYSVVKIQFFFWSFETSRAIIIFSTLIIGIILGWIAFLIKNRKY